MNVSENATVLKTMTDQYPRLSASHQQIADVILQDTETAAFYNVAELARAAKVSDATVTRFARAIGCSGFPELSQQLQAVVRLRLTTKERLEKAWTVGHETRNDIVWQSVEGDIQNLHILLDDLDVDGLDLCANALMAAQTIGIICSRSTMALGMFFQFYLNFLQKNVLLINGDPRTLDGLGRLHPSHDVVVGMGFSRYSRFTVNSIQYLSTKGLPVYVITDYAASPLARYATKAFYCPTGIASHMESFVAPMALLQALILRMSSALYATTMEELTRLEEIWRLFDVYYEEAPAQK